MVFKPTDEEFTAILSRKNPLAAAITRRKLAERIEAVSEVVLYDSELRSEYLTDEERELIVAALKRI